MKVLLFAAGPHDAEIIMSNSVFIHSAAVLSAALGLAVVRLHRNGDGPACHAYA
ncbi:MAG: hypothetical protein GX803_05735 [Lentisphaerae bacterium]|jgi:hypothetical protein|nr:hypothetical protein [Lentisphaerota bacterium]